MAIRQCATENEAFSRLKWHYDNRDAFAQECREAGTKVVGQLGFGVPEELILAHDMQPVKICAENGGALNFAEMYLEYSFAAVAKSQFERIVSGSYNSTLDYIAISDSSDIANRLYFYLREINRSEPERQFPEIYFVDWLFSRNLMCQMWNEKAIAHFSEQLERWAGSAPSDDRLREAILLCNEQRQAVREFSALRREDAPRVTGCEALVVASAGFFMPKAEHARLVRALVKDAASWPAIAGKRVVFTGSAQENTDVYAEIEGVGTVIVCEDHDWGDRAYELDTRTDIPALKAVVERYMTTSFSAQKALVSQRVRTLLGRAQAARADAVVFYYNEYDDAASWDYPKQKAALENIGVACEELGRRKYPDLSLRSDAAALISRIGA